MSTILRPMSTGEILDRTFNLYRSNFLVFAGIASLTPGLMLIVNFSLIAAGINLLRLSPANDPVTYFGRLAVYVVGGAITSAATVYAVSMLHLEKPVSISASYKSIGRHFGRLVLLVVMILLLMTGIMALFIVPLVLALAMPQYASELGILALIGGLIALVLIVHLYARYALAMAACVIEKLPARRAMKRSLFLTKGASGRVWIIFLLTLIINLALSFALVIPISVLLARGVITLSMYTIFVIVSEFLTGTLAGPILTVALALMYYDQRVRREAFDLQLMMESLGQAPEQAAAAAPIG